jgi:MSHA biogenesis protein MshP
MNNMRLNQRGFLLPAAIFLLVILAGLGAYAVNISTIQQNSAIQDVQGTRAYHAAKTGTEWAAYQIMQNTPDNTVLPTCPATTTLSIDAFNVAVSCTPYGSYNEQGTDHTINVYEIISTASYGVPSTAGYIERQIQVTISKCRGTDAATPYQCS